jgi:hypothetical protein
MADFVEVANDPHGSFVLQECLIHCDGVFICEAASAHWVEVVNDKYGSHALGKWLSLCDDQQMNRFLDRLKGVYVDLSMHEFDSCVAEKCLECAGDEQFTRLIKKRLIVNPWLDQIIQDRYGNYVIQVTLKQSNYVIHVAFVFVDAFYRHASDYALYILTVKYSSSPTNPWKNQKKKNL